MFCVLCLADYLLALFGRVCDQSRGKSAKLTRATLERFPDEFHCGTFRVKMWKDVDL